MTIKPIVLVSACLLGFTCRYDGKAQRVEAVQSLANKYRLLPICPERLGGLTVPRPPAEIRGGRVYNNRDEEVTDYFLRGAKLVGKLAQRYECKAAVLKANSPSCGYGYIYDGTFTGRKIEGNGLTATHLLKLGLKLVNENTLAQLEQEASHTK
ncbi:MAG: DUF523 domain-containing protein [Acidaminococcaceae bacterium]